MLSIAGSAHVATFRRADGSPYGDTVNPGALDVFVKVFSGLRNLGFRELEVRSVLEEVRGEVPSGAEPTAEGLLRAALVRLRPRTRAPS